MNDSNLVFYGNILSCLLGDFLHRGCVSIPHYFLFFLLFFTNLSGKNSTYLPFSDQWNFPHLSIGPVYLRFKGCWVVFIIFIPFFFFSFRFSIFILYITNTEHIITNLQFHKIMKYNHACYFLSLFSSYTSFHYI